MKPLLLLDLDRTLFKTEEYWQDFAIALARASNKPDSTYNSGYKEFLVGEDRLQMVDYGKILAITKTTHQKIMFQLASIAKGKNYLFDDAKQLLASISDFDLMYEIAIITFGDNKYQALKINLVPEIANIPKYIIQTYKADYIKSFFGGRHGILVDDKFGQNLPDRWVEIHLKRQETILPPEQIDDKIYRVTSLADILMLAIEINKELQYG